MTTNWLPIETAPRDGRLILAIEPDHARWSWGILYCRANVNRWLDEHGDVWEPTHWMPLPDPPTNQTTV